MLRNVFHRNKHLDSLIQRSLQWWWNFSCCVDRIYQFFFSSQTFALRKLLQWNWWIGRIHTIFSFFRSVAKRSQNISDRFRYMIYHEKGQIYRASDQWISKLLGLALHVPIDVFNSTQLKVYVFVLIQKW